MNIIPLLQRLLTQHIWGIFASVTPFPNFWAGAGDEARLVPSAKLLLINL